MKLDLSKRPHVIIVSTSKHKDVARGIAETIKSSGGEPALVSDTVELGQEWQTAIKSEIDQSQAAVVVVGPESYRSPRMREEWSRIQGRIWDDPDFKVVPVIVEGAELPPFLKRWHAVQVLALDTVAIAKAVKGIVTAEENVRPLSKKEQADVEERYRAIAQEAEDEIAEFQLQKPDEL